MWSKKVIVLDEEDTRAIVESLEEMREMMLRIIAYKSVSVISDNEWSEELIKLDLETYF